MTFCSLLYRKKEDCSALGGKLLSLWSDSVPSYSEGWASLMQFTALGAAPPGETQLLSPACEVLLWIYQTQQHSEPARRIPSEVWSCMCVLIHIEMKIPDQHCASGCCLISVIHNLLVTRLSLQKELTNHPKNISSVCLQTYILTFVQGRIWNLSSVESPVTFQETGHGYYTQLCWVIFHCLSLYIV